MVTVSEVEAEAGTRSVEETVSRCFEGVMGDRDGFRGLVRIEDKPYLPPTGISPCDEADGCRTVCG